MAEFCLACWNRINKTNDSARKYIMSKELDLCEGCGAYTHVVVIKRYCYFANLKISLRDKP